MPAPPPAGEADAPDVAQPRRRRAGAATLHPEEQDGTVADGSSSDGGEVATVPGAAAPPRARGDNAPLPEPSPLALDAAFFGTALAAVALLFARKAPDAYMDEPFHVGQTAAYCAGRWRVWDPKITTPPGLYVLGVAWARGLHMVRTLLSSLAPARFAAPPAWGSPAACSTSILRALNVPLAAAGFAAAVAVHRSLHPASPPDVSTLTGLAVALLPTHAFFGWLFYTDVAGLALLLSAWAASLRRRYALAGLLATAAASTRQTHAVWAAPLALAALIAEADATRPAGAPTLARAAPGSAPRQTVALARAVAARPRSTLGVVWPLALPQLALAALIAWNGGAVALGDKAAHAPGLHFAQSVYGAAFAAAALALPFLSFRTAALAVQDAGGHTGALFVRGVLARTLAGWLAARDGAARAHPYLLADNRHLAFYGWRAYARTWPAGVLGLAFSAAGLGYGWVAALLRAGAAGWGGGDLWVAGLAAAAAAALVPAPLVEPRYFTPLAAMALLAAPPGRPARLVLTCLAFAGVGAGLVWLFLERPFVGADGEVARFLW